MGMYRNMHNSLLRGVLVTKPLKANFIFYSWNAATAHIEIFKFLMNNKILQFCYTGNHSMKVCNLKVLIKVFSEYFFNHIFFNIHDIYWFLKLTMQYDSSLLINIHSTSNKLHYQSLLKIPAFCPSLLNTPVVLCVVILNILSR